MSGPAEWAGVGSLGTSTCIIIAPLFLTIHCILECFEREKRLTDRQVYTCSMYLTIEHEILKKIFIALQCASVVVLFVFHKNLNWLLSLHLHPCRIDVNVAMPQSLSAFHMHAVVPVIQCIVNTVGQPQLCHSTLCLIREVSAHTTQL